MTDLTFNTAAGQTIARDLLVLYLNVGEKASPRWSPLGKRVEDSSAEYDWKRESKKDILGNTYTSMKKPIVTQSFDPWDLGGGDEAQLFIWNKAIREQDAQALCNMDMLVVHLYAGTANTAAFAERYDACSAEVTRLGGEGGGNIAMSTTVTYGGERSVGTASVSGSTVTYTAA